MMNSLLLGEINTICRDASPILQIVGWVLMVFKIGIPLIIIALGLFDLGKAAVSSKPEDMKKSITSLVWRLVGGIAIFFVPTLIMLVFGMVSGFSTQKDNIDWNVCYKCIVNPMHSDCTGAVSIANNADPAN